jgi:hypothetical protein
MKIIVSDTGKIRRFVCSSCGHVHGTWAARCTRCSAVGALALREFGDGQGLRAGVQGYMKAANANKKHAVTLTFLLNKKISPQILEQKLASRCGGCELMPSEAILVEHAKIACVVTDETLSLPSFGWQWHTSLKEPKRPKLTRNRCK